MEPPSVSLHQYTRPLPSGGQVRQSEERSDELTATNFEDENRVSLEFCTRSAFLSNCHNMAHQQPEPFNLFSIASLRSSQHVPGDRDTGCGGVRDDRSELVCGNQGTQQGA